MEMDCDMKETFDRIGTCGLSVDSTVVISCAASHYVLDEWALVTHGAVSSFTNFMPEITLICQIPFEFHELNQTWKTVS